MLKPWRKLWRMGGLLFPILYFFQPKAFMLVFTAVFLVFFLVLEIIRFKNPDINDTVFQRLDFLLKEKEKKKLTTTTLFLIGVFVSILFFPKPIAILALFYLIFGDSLAEIVGLTAGRIKIFDKTLEGSMACLAICILIGVIFYYQMGVRLLAVVLGAVAATIIELLPVRLDDNLTIPIVSGLVMSLLSI
jgi:glycerol-3-phosphate acyltransferase PlsY